MATEILMQIVATGFPSGSSLIERASEVNPRDRFYVIPGNNSPRWLFPAAPNSAIRYLKQWQPYKISSRAKWELILTAYRAGMLGKLPGVSEIGISGIQDNEWSHIDGKYTSRPSPIVYIGTPGDGRKAVIALTDGENGNPLSIVKVPMGKEAGSAICHEIGILKKLKKENTELAPHAYFLDQQKCISAQELVEGKASKKVFSNAHMSFLMAMKLSERTITLQSIAEILDQTFSKNGKMATIDLALIRQLVDFLDDNTEFPAMCIHGDFAPWNLKIRPNGRLLAVDWESAEPYGLPLFDLVYFHSILGQLFGEKFMTTHFHKKVSTYLNELNIPTYHCRNLILGSLALDWLRTKNTERKNYLWRLLSEILDTTS